MDCQKTKKLQENRHNDTLTIYEADYEDDRYISFIYNIYEKALSQRRETSVLYGLSENEETPRKQT